MCHVQEDLTWCMSRLAHATCIALQMIKFKSFADRFAKKHLISSEKLNPRPSDYRSDALTLSNRELLAR